MQLKYQSQSACPGSNTNAVVIASLVFVVVYKISTKCLYFITYFIDAWESSTLASKSVEPGLHSAQT